MRDFNIIIIKYVIIVIGLFILRVLLSAFYPDLITETIVTESYTSSKTSLFGLYITNVFNIVLAVFILFDLRKYGIRNLIIPLLTILSSYLGLFLTALLIIHIKLKIKIDEK